MQHGKNGSYTKHGCRCDECKLAHAQYQAAYLAASTERRERHRAATAAWRHRQASEAASYVNDKPMTSDAARAAVNVVDPK